VVNFAVVDDSKKVCDEWETPTVISYERGQWVARQDSPNDGSYLKEIRTKHITHGLGDQDNYRVEFTLVDGRRVSYKELEDELRAAE
jgi:hypothetical protein